MRRPRTRGLTVPRALLGLVVQQPGTVASIGDRLVETFPWGQWEDNEAHKALPRMERQGLVCAGPAGAKGDAGLRWYQATQLGVADMRGWLREPALMPHALRDSLQAKLEFMAESDLPSLIEMVQEEEESCDREYERAHKLSRQSQYTRMRLAPARAGWREKKQDVRVGDEAVVWQCMALRLKSLREQLEALRDEITGADRERGERG